MSLLQRLSVVGQQLARRGGAAAALGSAAAPARAFAEAAAANGETATAGHAGAAGGAAAARPASNLQLDDATVRFLERQAQLAAAEAAAVTTRSVVATSVPVVDLATGQPTGAVVSVDERIAGAPIRPDIVHRVIVWQEKKARETLYKAKSRAEVSGGGKKPWKQKGTGRARAGSTRSPLWKGGGVAHPPKLRDWAIGLQKKVRRLGMRIALAAKLRDGRLTVVPTLDLPAGSHGKTKEGVAVLEAHGVVDKRTLWIAGDAGAPPKFVRSVSNIPRTTVLPQIGANVADIVKAERLFVTADGWAALQARVTREA